MSEETEGQDTGAEAVAGGVDPAAAALALAGAGREEANAFLNDQRRLIEVQMHHLHVQLKQLTLGVWEKPGKAEDAEKQFARAGALDLTPSEKSELARHP